MIHYLGEHVHQSSDVVLKNPITLPENVTTIIMRSDYLEHDGVRGKCFLTGEDALHWLFRLQRKISWWRRLRGKGVSALLSLRDNFSQYVAQARAARGPVCVYAAIYGDHPILRMFRRATAEHEHAHALVKVQLKIHSYVWFTWADELLYKTCDLAWLDIKDAVYTKYVQRRKISLKAANRKVIDESLARIAAMLATKQEYWLRLSRYQLPSDPEALKVISKCVLDKFGSFEGLVARVGFE